MGLADQLSNELFGEAKTFQASDFQGKLTNKQRTRLFRAIWQSTNKDFRTSKGVPYHPSVMRMGPKGSEFVSVEDFDDDELRAFAKKKRVLSEQYVIGAGGLENPQGEQLTLAKNRVYFMGASSSPDRIFVTGVSPDGNVVTYRSYPYDKDKKIQGWIARDLIQKGTKTALSMYGRRMDSKLKRSLEDMMKGGPGLPAKLSDLQRVTVVVKGAPGYENTDLWYDAEKYGNVGGHEKDGVNFYDIDTDGSRLKQLKKDKKFVIVSTKKR